MTKEVDDWMVVASLVAALVVEDVGNCTETLVGRITEILVLVAIETLVLDIGTTIVEVVEVCVELIVESEAVGRVRDNCSE